MGTVHATLELKNPRDRALAPVTVTALVDTGSNYLCIPEHLALQLRLETLEQREVVFADGSRGLCSYVGPLQVGFANRGCFVGALVLGDEVLLGAVPLEDMDLVVLPATRTLSVNPASPNIASGIVKPAARSAQPPRPLSFTR